MSTRILFTLLGIGFFGLLFYKLGKSALVSRSSSYLSDATSHTVGSPVSVCVSKTWPYHNPLETYDFYGKLGVCTPAEQESAPMTLGQILRGDRLLKSGYEISYGVKQETPKILCTLEADRAVVLNWQDLIDQSYFFEMYVDELPIHQAFGVRIFQKKKLGGKKTLGDREDGVDAKEGEKVQDTEKASQPQQKREYGEEDFEESDYEYRYYLRTHLHFILGYNEGQVVHASLGSEDLNKDFLDITDPPVRTDVDLSTVKRPGCSLSCTCGDIGTKNLSSSLSSSLRTCRRVYFSSLPSLPSAVLLRWLLAESPIAFLSLCSRIKIGRSLQGKGSVSLNKGNWCWAMLVAHTQQKMLLLQLSLLWRWSLEATWSDVYLFISFVFSVSVLGLCSFPFFEFLLEDLFPMCHESSLLLRRYCLMPLPRATRRSDPTLFSAVDGYMSSSPAFLLSFLPFSLPSFSLDLSLGLRKDH